jgi:hypothetical protein
VNNESGKRISSRNTFFVKRVFPVLWLGGVALFLATALAGGMRAKAQPPLVFFVVPFLMFGFGYWLMRRLVFDLADAVYDEGDALRVRLGGEEERILLANIINISYSGLTNPARATLTLREPGRFGKEVTFSPVQKVLGPLLRTSNPIISDLIERADAARRR